uniref:Uncharacterized protein n=1 Tax=Timema monikensis TaxID=170555 RepID=A0A7R9HS48_9NEOP|nr:unnamed protein product [Timema monikensis]
MAGSSSYWDDTGLPPKKSVNSQDGLYGEVKGAGQHVRSKMKTNGHFTSYMQSRQESAGLSPEWCQSPNRLPKTRPPTSRSGSLARQDVMTQSCPTPPQNRRKFFLSPKSLRGAWGQKGDQVGPPRLQADIVDNPSALSEAHNLGGRELFTRHHSLTSHHHWSLRTTHCTDLRYTKTRLADSLTGHAGPFPDMLAHSLDTLVHSRTRWSTPFTVLQFDWDPSLSADFSMSSSKYVSVLCLVSMSSSKYVSVLCLVSMSSSKYMSVLCLVSMSSSKYVSVLCLVSMSSSTESRYWPSLVLNKIRSLWSIGASAAGLNQLAGRTPSLACVIVSMSCCCRSILS